MAPGRCPTADRRSTGRPPWRRRSCAPARGSRARRSLATMPLISPPSTRNRTHDPLSPATRPRKKLPTEVGGLLDVTANHRPSGCAPPRRTDRRARGRDRTAGRGCGRRAPGSPGFAFACGSGVGGASDDGLVMTDGRRERLARPRRPPDDATSVPRTRRVAVERRTQSWMHVNRTANGVPSAQMREDAAG